MLIHKHVVDDRYTITTLSDALGEGCSFFETVDGVDKEITLDELMKYHKEGLQFIKDRRKGLKNNFHPRFIFAKNVK